MNRRHNECRSEGCGGEVVFKTVDGAFVDHPERQRGLRGSPNGYHRHSVGPTQIMSAYCKQHTCIHFAREEGCNNKKPPHDSVCAIHARCPVQDCIQARGQYLDTKFEHVPGSVPRYARYELCFDHKCQVRTCHRGRTSSKSPYCSAHGCQAEGCGKPSQDQRNCCAEHECKAEGCRTIVEGEYPFCVIHVKCDVQNCNMARHLLAKTKEYLDYCTDHATCQVARCREIKKDGSLYCPSHTCRERDCDRSCSIKSYCDNHGCAEPSCDSPKSRGGKQKNNNKFCPLHTCRSLDCYELVGPLALFCDAHSCCKDNCLHKAMAEQLCISHFKEEYVAQGEREREASERRRFSQPFKQRHFNVPVQRSHHQDANSSNESATETESDNEKDEPSSGGPRRFTDSHVSGSGGGSGATVKPIPAPSKREWQKESPAFVQSNHAPLKKKKGKQQRHWVDDTSPRGSKVGSITDSLVAENGESYAGFDDGGPGALPGSYPVGGSSKPVGNKRTNSMPSESGASTATTRVL